MFNANDHLVNVMMIDCNLWIIRQASLPHQYGVGKAGGRSPIEMATNDRLPIILTKMEEPQTAVSPLLGLIISVVY